MSTTDPPSPSNDEANYGIDSEDEEADASNNEEASGLIAAPPEEQERTNQILSSYREYLSHIQEELPPAEVAPVIRAGPLEPDEESTPIGLMDPPEEEEEEAVPLRSRIRGKLALRGGGWRKNKRDKNQVVYEEEDELDEMYQDLGVTRPSRKVRYTHPILHSFKDKRCIAGLAVAAALLAIILGVTLSRKPEGDNWESELKNVITKQEDKLHDMLHADESSLTDGSEVLTQAQRESEEYQRVVETYKPLWYERGDGWDGQSYDEAILFCASNSRILCPYEAYCPLGPSTVPLGGGQRASQSWAPLIDNENGWCKEWKDMYTGSPSWGETGAGSEIITEHIMCCASHVIDGKQRPGAQQTSTTTTEAPVEPGDTNWEQVLYQNVSNQKYKPTWYSRSTGWDGQTHIEALKFCALKKSILCPFEAICPDGAQKSPYGGDKLAPAGGVAWTPIVATDQENEWVGVSKTMTCIKYTNVHESTPSWGKTGGNEAETRNIACCAAVEGGFTTENSAQADANVASDSAVNGGTGTSNPETSVDASSEATASVPAVTTPATTDSPTPAPSYLVTLEETEEIVSTSPPKDPHAYELIYQSVSEMHEPVWFDRSKGWMGLTWIDARSFCSAQIGFGEKAMQLCPLGVICPIPHETPILGAREEPTDDERGRGAWAPFGNMENGWVKVDATNPCAVYNSVYGTAPAWGMTGEGTEAITRNVLCCKSTSVETSLTTPPPTNQPSMQPASSPVTPPPTVKKTNKPTNDKLVGATFDKSVEKYQPVWHDRTNWKGSSYTDAIEFCAKQNSVLCPYEAYCPLGPGVHIYGGIKDTSSSWAPLIDVPNGWVQVGPQDTCELYNSLHPHPPIWGLNGNGDGDLTKHVMCCDDGFTTIAESAALANQPPIYSTPTAMEQKVLDHYHPIWLQRKHGYDGTTVEESMDFCQHVADMELCPIDAYCPNGASGLLFYGRDAFDGEQWAPVTATPTASADWVLIGSMDGVATCTSYSDNYGTTAPWETDGSSEEKKQHVLCCQKKNYVQSDSSDVAMTLDEVMANELKPVWYDLSHGWNGGSHNDAELFCSANGNRELCPSVAICPNGKGQAPIGGHNVDFNAVGEQWVPVGGMDNHWIQVGQKYENLATTCMDYQELEGENSPDWGTNSNEASKKKYVLCCQKFGS
ncbi:hypothetical protein HJC23_002336 [Cyclotella cryptica]|uniref:DUF7495 domain-containing protein n=1 Tax=Cyclotella cryptica TaxID=29204 RepID=A0ABD3QLT4_9STRA